VATAHVFGGQHAGSNYGLVLTSFNLASCVAVVALAKGTSTGDALYRNAAVVALAGCALVVLLLYRTQKQRSGAIVQLLSSSIDR
jgi:hypothetical protein